MRLKVSSEYFYPSILIYVNALAFLGCFERVFEFFFWKVNFFLIVSVRLPAVKTVGSLVLVIGGEGMSSIFLRNIILIWKLLPAGILIFWKIRV